MDTKVSATDQKPGRRLHTWCQAIIEVGVLVTVFGPMYFRFELKETGHDLYKDATIWALCGIFIIGSSIEIERRF